MIKANKLRKVYGETQAVKELSFEISDGEVVGFLGPNGAGKTTTMRMLTTFVAPSGGTAEVAGYDICKQASEVRQNIGYLPETPALYPEMKVIEYLRYVAQLKNLSKKSIKSSLAEVLERFLIADVKEKLCAQLSRGYRQRVGLAAALIHNPKVIILDEPTSGLDPAQIIEIRELIKGLAGDHSVILSTHILSEVSETCSKVIIISDGELVASGSVEELTENKTLEERFLEAVSA
jgi:ABC-2 type transport system ATP-binding protein